MCLPAVESVSLGLLGGGAKEDDERQLEPKRAEPCMDDILGTFCALVFLKDSLFFTFTVKTYGTRSNMVVD